ncbi:hypothetical protein CJ430_31620, partial [Klebsiella pneumoniae]
NFTEVEPALAYLREKGARSSSKPTVVAAGKGVIVAMILNFTEVEPALAYLREKGARSSSKPTVVAAGKGV